MTAVLNWNKHAEAPPIETRVYNNVNYIHIAYTCMVEVMRANVLPWLHTKTSCG